MKQRQNVENVPLTSVENRLLHLLRLRLNPYFI